ncbi:MAG: TIGR04149 family rSAM-modified RiPP [Tannerella sp.]|jgi:natural product precursor|nr:TIGR04149 family rSAM-modified RiPP [Tannerella sp.]
MKKLSKIRLSTVSDKLSDSEMKNVRGGGYGSGGCHSEEPCTVTCGNNVISQPYGNCVDIGWSSSCSGSSSYSCSGYCRDLC